MDINTATLTGRIGNDLEIHHTPQGTAVLDLNLAVESGFGDKRKTNWIGCTVWGKSAEALAEHSGKGRKIAVTGRLEQEEWTDKETGKKQRKTRVIVENWTFADSRERTAGEVRKSEVKTERSDRMPEDGGRPDSADDDIPY